MRKRSSSRTLCAIASRRNLSWLARRTAASISRRNSSIVSIVSMSMWFVGSVGGGGALLAGGAPAPPLALAGARGAPRARPPHPRLEAGEVGLDPLRLRAGGGQNVAHRGLRRYVRHLREVAEAEPRFEHEVPQVRLRLPREELEEGALPRAVGADEGDLVPRLAEEVRVLEDERGTPGFPEVPAA